MTNLELFKLLDKETQLNLVQTLAAFEKCHVTYYSGKYHVETAVYLLGKYPVDYKAFDNEFYSKEFYQNTMWYHNAWYNFINEKERNGEENEIITVNGKHDGKFQYEFETNFAAPRYEKALQDYLNQVRA